LNGCFDAALFGRKRIVSDLRFKARKDAAHGIKVLHRKSDLRLLVIDLEWSRFEALRKKAMKNQAHEKETHRKLLFLGDGDRAQDHNDFSFVGERIKNDLT
jgi:hypothetical protein